MSLSDNNIRFDPNQRIKGANDHAEGSAPTSAPKASTDFRKVMAKDRRQSKSTTENKKTLERKKSVKDVDDIDEDDTDDQAIAEQPVVSLFDLSRNPTDSKLASSDKSKSNFVDALDKNTPVPAQASANDVESPSELFKRLSGTKAAKIPEKDIEYPGTNLQGVQQQDLAKKGESGQFSQEQIDMAYLNMVGKQTFISPALITETEVSTPVVKTNLQELVTQMIDKLQVLKKEGLTETIIVLKHPPDF